VKREFSAGGLVVRRFRGRPFLAVVKVKDGAVMALPKGHPDEGESMREAAVREVREETGLETEALDKVGDVRYWYTLHGERVLKVVSFYLCRYLSGRIEDHDHEVDAVEWVPLDEAASRLTYRGERQMASQANERIT
jgi:8-oxo-dGTP pyrophosphatase MutT (NUDIX family)